MLGQAVPLEGGIVGVLDDIRGEQRDLHVQRDLFSLRQIYDFRIFAIETIGKQQYFEITGLHISVQSGILDVHAGICLDVDGHMPHYRG